MAKHTADANSPPPRHSQTRMDDFRQKHMDTTTKNKLIAAIAKWVGIACRPVNVVENEGLAQGWENFLTRGPQWVLKFDRGAGPGPDGWNIFVN